MAEYIEREQVKDELMSWAVCIKHPEHLLKEDALCVIDAIPAADVVEVVRCKNCQWFKPAHFKANDGTEHHWDDSFFIVGRTDGIYIGAKCKHERNTAYGEKDMAFRRPTDFCSYGERRDNNATD